MTFWLGVFAAACTVQIGYWLLLRRGFGRALDAARLAAPAMPPVSVVVAARDEAARLPALFEALSHQRHSPAEILLVDDGSVDDTPQVVRAWQQQLPALRWLRIDHPEPPRKKRALTQGIEAAQNELLAFTDADCTPGPDWLAGIAGAHAAAPAAPAPSVLVGYSPFRRAPGLVNRLARYETFVTGFLTAAAIGLGQPYMAVGRNLSYGKSTFRQIDGFGAGLQSMSGDDDLLVQEVARRRAAAVRALLDPTTFVPTEAPTTWRAWLRQKRRHVSAGRFYAPRIQVHLTLFHATSVGLWAAPFVLGWAGVGLLAGKLLVQRVVLHRAAHALHERDLLPAQPFLELLYAAYNLLVAPVGLVRRPKRW